MMSGLYRDPDINLSNEQKFGETEVGLKHPLTGSFVRLCDDGSIQICVGERGETAIVMNERGVTIYADKINLVTGFGGLTWNGKSFNPKATYLGEATLLDLPREHRNPSSGLDEYGSD